MGVPQASPLPFQEEVAARRGVLSVKRDACAAKPCATVLAFANRQPARFGKSRRRAVREDESAILRIQNGDRDALNALFSLHRGRLYRAAFGVLRNKEEAEDAVQEGLLSAYLHIADFQRRSLFSTWLTRIVINAALMKRRKQMSIPEVSFETENSDSSEAALEMLVPSNDPDPEQLYVASEIRQLVRKRVSQLSDGHRSAIQLRYIEGLSTTEAARTAEISVCKLKSRLFHARRQLALRWANPLRGRLLPSKRRLFGRRSRRPAAG